MSSKPLEQERDRGILSKADRAFLNGEKDLTEQGKRDARYRIRNRIENGILDFQLLLHCLSEQDRTLFFEKLNIQDISMVFQFIFEGIVDTTDSLDTAKETFENIIASAVVKVYAHRDEEHIINNVTVNITVDKTRPDINKLIEKYRHDEESFDELQFLMQSNKFTGEEELLMSRMLKHLHTSGGIDDEIKETILSESNYDTLDDYFQDIDKKIAQEGSDTEENESDE